MKRAKINAPAAAAAAARRCPWRGASSLARSALADSPPGPFLLPCLRSSAGAAAGAKAALTPTAVDLETLALEKFLQARRVALLEMGLPAALVRIARSVAAAACGCPLRFLHLLPSLLLLHAEGMRAAPVER